MVERYRKDPIESEEIVTEVMLILEGLKSLLSSGIKGRRIIDVAQGKMARILLCL